MIRAEESRIEVHSPQTCRDLHFLGAKNDDNDEIDDVPARNLDMSPTRHSGDVYRSVSRVVSGRLSRTFSRDTDRLSRLSSAAQIAQVQSWLTRKARRAVVALPESPEVAEMELLCQTLLSEEQELLSELDAATDSRASEAVSKREMLYHKWSKRVFDPLHSQITRIIGGREYQELEKDKRRLFQDYVTYRNKQRVFLDTISGRDYNPLSLTDTNKQLTVVTGKLDDPLVSQQTDRTREKRILSGIPEKEEVLGERDLDAVNWLTLQLVHVDSTVRKRSQLRVQGDHNEMQAGGGHLILPHKTPATNPSHTPLSLRWPEPSSRHS